MPSRSADISSPCANPVEIRLQDQPNYVIHGHMDFVDNSLDPSSGTIRARAVIDNPTHFLTPGMFGHLRLLGSGAYPALLIPDQATATDQVREIVYVLGPGGKVLVRQVQLGPLYGGLRVIRSGLGPNDLVIIEGIQRIRGGIEVMARQRKIPTPTVVPAATPEGYTAPLPTGAKPASGPDA